MQRAFGHTIKFNLSSSRPWLSLGPGWAAIGGMLSSGLPDFDLTSLLQVVLLWLLVDPLLGTLWTLTVEQGLWRRVTRAILPSPFHQGFNVPYAQPGSMAGYLVLLGRRYQRWWGEQYWPKFGGEVVTFGVGLALALLLGLAFNPTIFWLVLLSVCLSVLAGLGSADLSLPGGGRLQSVVQFLLPWLIGAMIGSPLSQLSFVLALGYWATYLGGLRMVGNHHRAEVLFFLGQAMAILLLLAFRLVPGAAILSVLLVSQLLIKTQFGQPEGFLHRVQPYLILSILVAGLSLGSLSL